MCKKSYKSINKFKVIFFLLLIVILVASSRKFQITKISGQSMEPTLKNRQIVLVQKERKKYNYNNIITFKSKEYGVCVKRIEGVAGDIIELKNGKVYRNGIEISGYICDKNRSSKFVLGNNEFFVLGDNANESIDSRLYGPIKRSNIIGKILLM